MRVVDTSAWIEWFAGSSTGQLLRAEFPGRSLQVVPTIVQYELAVWAARELQEASADILIADSQKCVIVELDSEIAIRAAEVRRVYRLPTADAIVYATALQRGADVLTCDVHFKGLPHVVYVPKAVS